MGQTQGPVSSRGGIMILVLELVVMIVALVVIHELGHFITAKLFGVKVNEFGIGFPPKLFGWKKGETEYTLNSIPLGGFVKLEGETNPNQPRSLANKKPYIRLIILGSGSFMNALLALIIFTGLFMTPRDVSIGNVIIQEVSTNSPAQLAGLLPGDEVVYVNEREINSIGSIRDNTYRNLGSEITITVQRNQILKQITLIPRWNPPTGEGPTGITLALENARTIQQSYPIWKAIPKATVEIQNVLFFTWHALLQWVIGEAPFPGSGPVGIVKGTQEVVSIAGITALIPIAALLSISLAVFNMLPIPSLDGGRSLFALVEWIRGGKRISPEKEGLFHMMGFAILIAIIIAISYNDVLRIIRGDSFIR